MQKWSAVAGGGGKGTRRGGGDGGGGLQKVQKGGEEEATEKTVNVEGVELWRKSKMTTGWMEGRKKVGAWMQAVLPDGKI